MLKLLQDESESLSNSVYLRLKEQLMRAELQPHQRLKVRELAHTMGTSETPIREALMLLSREGAVEIKPRYYIRVRRVTCSEYEQIRDIRLVLEPMAGERALPHMTDADIAELETLHHRLIEAENTGEWAVALQANFDFHFHLYRKSGLTHLLEVIEGLWVRIGPSLSALYPDAIPTYAYRHQHENVIDALRARDAYALRMAIQLDLIEGGTRLIRHLRAMEGS